MSNDTYASRRARAIVKALPEYAWPDESQPFVASADAVAAIERVLTVRKSIAIEDVADLLRTLLDTTVPASTHPMCFAITAMRNGHNDKVKEAAAKLGITL